MTSMTHLANPFTSRVDPAGADTVSWWRTRIGKEELDAIVEAVMAERISMGAVTAELEAEIGRAVGVPYVVATTSGTAALLMSMMALEIGPGDEVIVPARTFVATANAVHVLGAKVVLADCGPETSNVPVAQIRERLTSRTRAIVPVHLNGRACDMEAILALAREHGIAVVEDAAQAIMSRTPAGYLGSLGELGVFSFGMTKLIATGQGGAVITRSRDHYERLRALRNNGVANVVDHTYVGPGLNFKFSDILASIGVTQMRRVAETVAHCRAIEEAYAAGLEGVSCLKLLRVDRAGGECGPWVEAVSERRAELMAFLAKRGIQTASFVPTINTAGHLGITESFPNADRFWKTGMMLPCGPAQPLENVARTVEAIRAFEAQ